jgi:hypothetical protein
MLFSYESALGTAGEDQVSYISGEIEKFRLLKCIRKKQNRNI